MTFKEIIKSFDQKDKKEFTEDNISTELKKCKPIDEEKDSELLSEIIGFDFAEDYQQKKAECDPYFRPMITGKKNDGSIFEYPSIQDITPQMVQYWKKRANESINPILKARYCGLVWEFEFLISNIKASHKICRECINALIEIAKGDYYKYKFSTF